MRREILLAGGLACLGLGLALASEDDVPRPPDQPVAGKAQSARQRALKLGDTPLPTQVWWTSRENRFLVNESGTGRVREVDTHTKTLLPTRAHFQFQTPRFVVPAANRKLWASIDPRLPVVQIVRGDFLELDSIKDEADVLRSIGIDPNPQALAMTPDSKTVLVACDTTGPADRRVCLVDVETGKVSYRAIRGSSNLRGIAVDPTGKFALAVHLVHKSHLPSTQIEQGWVFTNAITYLSLAGPPITVTLPLDLRTQGFANPEGVAVTPDGLKAYVAHAGADVVSVIDLRALLQVVAESAIKEVQQKAVPSVVAPEARGYLNDDLRVTRRYVRKRIPVGANPRGIAVSPDGKSVAVANRLDDSLSLIDAAADSVVATISLLASDVPPPQGEDGLIRQGERLFHSGGLSFSGQFSCASCHPDGHADGLNWDLPADGFNNFQNTKSLLSTDGTAPYGWLGTSPTLRDRFTGTLRHLFQHEPTDFEAAALEACLTQLPIPESGARPTAETQSAVARGKALFEGKAGCRACHLGPKFTDRSLHDIGTGAGGQGEFDTPALLRISTTAPYLHDGRAATLEEIFTKHNPSGLHGHAADLTRDELADLVEYLKSL